MHALVAPIPFILITQRTDGGKQRSGPQFGVITFRNKLRERKVSRIGLRHHAPYHFGKTTDYGGPKKVGIACRFAPAPHNAIVHRTQTIVMIALIGATSRIEKRY